MNRSPNRASIIRRTLLGICGLAAFGCAVPTEKCTADLDSTLQVDVILAASGLPAAAGATVVLHGAAIDDSITVPTTPDPGRFAVLWYEDSVRAGTYTVRVRKPGYQLWSESNIRVGASRCHAGPLVHVTAMLVPVAPSAVRRAAKGRLLGALNRTSRKR